MIGKGRRFSTTLSRGNAQRRGPTRQTSHDADLISIESAVMIAPAADGQIMVQHPRVWRDDARCAGGRRRKFACLIARKPTASDDHDLRHQIKNEKLLEPALKNCTIWLRIDEKGSGSELI
jgi:hypothetical protein